jgi:hypothetical protein
MADNSNDSQVDIAGRLQLKLLKRFETLLDNGEITSTDMATLSRLLMSNGWSIDPTKVPARLRDVLTKSLGALDIDEDEDRVN